MAQVWDVTRLPGDTPSDRLDYLIKQYGSEDPLDLRSIQISFVFKETLSHLFISREQQEEEETYFRIGSPDSFVTPFEARLNENGEGEIINIKSIDGHDLPPIRKGTWLVELGNALMSALGVTKWYLSDESLINDVDFAFLRFFQGKKPWYQCFGYIEDPDDKDYSEDMKPRYELSTEERREAEEFIRQLPTNTIRKMIRCLSSRVETEHLPALMKTDKIIKSNPQWTTLVSLLLGLYQTEQYQKFSDINPAFIFMKRATNKDDEFYHVLSLYMAMTSPYGRYVHYLDKE